jgi:hypothetical protein
VAAKYNLDNARYEEFEYACRINLENIYADNYVRFHLNLAEPIFENRLASHVGFWRTLNTLDWLLNTIEFGLRIPFERKPPRMLLHNSQQVLNDENIGTANFT